jgi:hypothetical protein
MMLENITAGILGLYSLYSDTYGVVALSPV